MSLLNRSCDYLAHLHMKMTTISMTTPALFVRHLAAQALPVVAIDADIYQHLAEAL
jgi:hypothetical protein